MAQYDHDKIIATIYLYRLCTKDRKFEWQWAETKEKIEQDIAEMNDKENKWTAEIAECPLTTYKSEIIGQFFRSKAAGSKTSSKKKISSRENGMLGGRPKKKGNE